MLATGILDFYTRQRICGKLLKPIKTGIQPALHKCGLSACAINCVTVRCIAFLKNLALLNKGMNYFLNP